MDGSDKKRLAPLRREGYHMPREGAMKRKILGAVALVGAAAVLYVFAAPSYRQGEASVAGRRAPDFAFMLGGQSKHLSDLRGQVVVLNFWASWCPPCVEETPSLNQLQETIAPQGGTVLGISVDEDTDAYAKFLQDARVIYPTYDDTSGKTPGIYGTSMYPETYVISRDGNIARKIVGAQNWQDPGMIESVESVLKQN
jgi:cytochrome c biogenesis protein CcmG, thiol:disulfide interchange protein DsbE